MNLQPLIASFHVAPLTVTRADPPTVNAFGGFDATATSSVILNPVAVHSVDGRELDWLPEADRNKELIEIYATVRLFASDGGKTADKVFYRNRSYRVMRVFDEELNGAVWRAYAALEEPS